MVVFYVMGMFVLTPPIIETPYPEKLEVDVTAIDSNAVLTSVSYLFFMFLFFAQSKFIDWFVLNHENNATLMLTLTNMGITCLMVFDIIFKQIHLQRWMLYSLELFVDTVYGSSKYLTPIDGKMYKTYAPGAYYLKDFYQTGSEFWIAPVNFYINTKEETMDLMSEAATEFSWAMLSAPLIYTTILGIIGLGLSIKVHELTTEFR